MAAVSPEQYPNTSSGGALTDGGFGDIVVSGTGTVMTVDSALMTAVGRAFTAASTVTAERAILGFGTVATADLSAVGTYTIADGVSHLVNSAAGTTYTKTIKLPAGPIENQYITISNGAYNVQTLTINSNGAEINAPGVTGSHPNKLFVISLAKYGSCTFSYTAANGWQPVVLDRMYHSDASTNEVGAAYSGTNGAGFRWTCPNVSQDYYMQQGLFWTQSTASGAGGTATRVGFWAQNTIDYGNATAGYAQYSYAGNDLTIYNSSIAFGGGATNDKQVEYYNRVTCRNHSANNFFTGQTSGAGVYTLWKNAPHHFADLTLGRLASFLELGNFSLVKPLCNESAAESTATGTHTITVPANIELAVLSGSGTATVEFPSSPSNGQNFTISLTTAYTTVTPQATGKTLSTGAAVGVTAGSFASWRYFTTGTIWVRVG